MGKGWVYRSEWHWERRSLFVEHPQQHTLKLRKYILRYFLLIQFFTALQISVAETQEYFSISNLTHSVWTVSRLVNCCDSWKNTTELDLSDRYCPLINFGLKQWSFEFCFWIMASASEALIFYLVEAFFPSKLAQIACLPAKTSSEISRITKIDSTHAEKKQLKFHIVVELFLFLVQFSFLFIHFHSS